MFFVCLLRYQFRRYAMTNFNFCLIIWHSLHVIKNSSVICANFLKSRAFFFVKFANVKPWTRNCCLDLMPNKPIFFSQTHTVNRVLFFTQHDTVQSAAQKQPVISLLFICWNEVNVKRTFFVSLQRHCVEKTAFFRWTASQIKFAK